MFKLMKYEYKKNRGIILGLILLVGGLELYYLLSCVADKIEHMGLASSFLVLAAVVCFFMVFVLGVNNYQKELDSKSSYLIFMTPNSSLKIIISKLVYILILGSVTTLVLGGLAILDIKLLFIKVNEEVGIIDLVNEFARSFDVDLSQVGIAVLLEIINFVLGFFSVVAIAYLAVTLSATFLQNSRYKSFVSVVFFIVLMIAVGWIDDKFIHCNMYEAVSYGEIFLNILPSIIYNAVIVVASVFGCSALLDKSVSL